MGPLLLFFLLFFSPVFCLFSCFLFFHFFSFFVHFFIFCFFFHVFHFFHFSEEKSFFSSFFLALLSNIFYCWRQFQSLTVSSVVGAPWRCGVLMTQGGIAGIGLGRLLGGEHASTPQSGVEAPRLLKRSLTRLYCGCCCCCCCCLTMVNGARYLCRQVTTN